MSPDEVVYSDVPPRVSVRVTLDNFDGVSFISCRQGEEDEAGSGSLSAVPDSSVLAVRVFLAIVFFCLIFFIAVFDPESPSEVAGDSVSDDDIADEISATAVGGIEFWRRRTGGGSMGDIEI